MSKAHGLSQKLQKTNGRLSTDPASTFSSGKHRKTVFSIIHSRVLICGCQLMRILAFRFLSQQATGLTLICKQNKNRSCAEVAPATVVVLTILSPVTVSLLAAAHDSKMPGSTDWPVKNKGTSCQPEKKSSAILDPLKQSRLRVNVAPEFFFPLPLRF